MVQRRSRRIPALTPVPAYVRRQCLMIADTPNDVNPPINLLYQVLEVNIFVRLENGTPLNSRGSRWLRRS